MSGVIISSVCDPIDQDFVIAHSCDGESTQMSEDEEFIGGTSSHP